MRREILRTLQRIGEAQIGGRIVDGIATHDDQQIDFARAHVGDEVAQGFSLIHWVGVDRVRVENGLIHVAESRVDLVSQSMHHGWLVIAGE